MSHLPYFSRTPRSCALSKGSKSHIFFGSASFFKITKPSLKPSFPTHTMEVIDLTMNNSQDFGEITILWHKKRANSNPKLQNSDNDDNDDADCFSVLGHLLDQVQQPLAPLPTTGPAIPMHLLPLRLDLDDREIDEFGDNLSDLDLDSPVREWRKIKKQKRC